MYFEDLMIGARRDIAPVVIDNDEMMAFAKKYAPSRIHIDKDYAENSRFGQLIAPGMLSFLAVWAQYVPLDFAGDELVAGISTSVEWHSPVFAGNLHFGGMAQPRVRRDCTEWYCRSYVPRTAQCTYRNYDS